LKEIVTFDSVDLDDKTLSGADCCVIITGHNKFDYDWIVDRSSLVVDAVNATRHVTKNKQKIFRLGASDNLLG
jgi:UDP-N-acetyl-D-mannosaminuronate dehydrogenase